MTAAPPIILSPSDPPPYRWLNEDAAAPCLLVCEHAARAVPPSLGTLGMEDRHFNTHRAVDIGAKELTEHLAQALDLPAILANYSRLAIDLNRRTGHPELFAQGGGDRKSSVPGNVNMTPEDREARIRELYEPFHGAVGGWIDSRLAAGEVPAIVVVHSFTQRLNGKIRRREIAAVTNKDRRIAEPFMEHLTKCGYNVGDNKPFDGRKGISATFNMHGTDRRLPNLAFEVRNDILQCPHTFAAAAAHIADALKIALSQPELYTLRP